ncbi:MAG: hemerythrin family protein [Candidatus Marinimicrobia bacterium]|nr:hemerythrin family protein [Candidatus Neomarinimicrobiota bacterium]
MTNYFKWKSDFLTGNSKVDGQHQYLFKLANHLQESEVSECRTVIMELYRYTRVHFSAEEELMSLSKYPLLKDHIKLHENLITILNDLSSQFEETTESRDDLVAFFGNWIVNHILNEDLRFANFIE